MFIANIQNHIYLILLYVMVLFRLICYKNLNDLEHTFMNIVGSPTRTTKIYCHVNYCSFMFSDYFLRFTFINYFSFYILSVRKKSVDISHRDVNED